MSGHVLLDKAWAAYKDFKSPTIILIGIIMVTNMDWTKLQVSDAEMEEAYEHVGGLKRSWMKKHIAYLSCMYGLDTSLEVSWSRSFRAGYISRRLSGPFPELFVFADNSHRAWNLLTAAVIPAIASGVGNIYVFLVSGRQKTCAEILTCLELSGVESIYLLEKSAAVSMIKEFVKSKEIFSVIDMCAESPYKEVRPESPCRRENYTRLVLGPEPQGLIWSEEDSTWDYEIIKWAHPDTRFTVAGPGASRASAHFDTAKKDSRELLARHYDIFLGPWDIFRSSSIAQGFAPGMEPFWLWPNLDKKCFAVNRVFWEEIQ